MTEPNHLESRFRGCIIGLAVGDALGHPTEFRSREQILESFGPGGVDDFVAQKDDCCEESRTESDRDDFCEVEVG